MRKLVALIALLSACGSPEVEWINGRPLHPELVDVPGQERRIDGSVWQDGIFETEQDKLDTCAEHPQAWFCGEFGSTEQGWASVEYHGMSSDDDAQTCYGPSAPVNDDCMFPWKRNFRIFINNVGCFDGPAPPNGPSTLQEQTILEGFRDAALTWNGHGGIGVCNANTPGCTQTGRMNVYINCDVPPNVPSDSFAVGGLVGVVSTPVGNAPVGPHSGKDVDDFKLSDLGHIAVLMQNVWIEAVGCYGAPTLQELRDWARYTSIHEFGHVLGFAHFDNATIMNPYRPNQCTPSIAIHSAYDNALQTFNPTGSGVSLQDGQLWAQQPL